MKRTNPEVDIRDPNTRRKVSCLQTNTNVVKHEELNVKTDEVVYLSLLSLLPCCFFLLRWLRSRLGDRDLRFVFFFYVHGVIIKERYYFKYKGERISPAYGRKK